MTTFKPVNFETLVDSPMFAGRYFKLFDLDPGAAVPVRLNVVADEAKYLDVKPDHSKRTASWCSRPTSCTARTTTTTTTSCSR